MGFWNKSEDPWDRDPARERAQRERASQERESMENPLDSLRAWNEQRKAEAAEKAAREAAEPPEKCPWCGKDMERGYISGNQHGVLWTPGRMTGRAYWIGPPREVRERQLRLDNEGDFVTWKTVWYCRDCEKMTLDAHGAKAPGSFLAEDSADPFPEKREEQEDRGGNREEDL